MKTINAAILITIASLFFGCKTTLVETRVHYNKTKSTNKDDSVLPTGGIVYNLPIQYFEVTIERTMLDLEKIQDDLKKSREKMTERETSLKETVKNIEKKEISQIPSDGTDAGALAIAKRELVTLQANKKVTEAYISDLAIQIAALIQKEVQAGKGELTENIGLKLLDPVGDPNAVYIARIHTSTRRHDSFKIGVSESGLLQTVDATSDDKSLDIVMNFAELVRLDQGLLDSSNKEFTVESIPIKKAPYKRVLVTDLADHKGIKKVNDILDSKQFDFNIHSFFQNSIDESTADHRKLPLKAEDAKPEMTEPETAESAKGLFYRTRTSLAVEIREKTTQATKAFAVYNIPNKERTAFLPINSSLFVKTTHKLEFSNGMLKTHDFDKPSELAAFFGFIPNIAKEILSIPTELLTFEINKTKQEADLIAAQTALLTAQENQTPSEESAIEARTNLVLAEIAKLKAEKDFEDAKRGIFQDPTQSDQTQ